MAARRTLLYVGLLIPAAAYLPPRTKMSRTATRRQNAWPEKPAIARAARRARRRVGGFAAGGPRELRASRAAPRVERFTRIDGADDRTATFYGAAFTAADATPPRPGVVLFHTAAGPRDRFVEWMAERLVAAGYTAVAAPVRRRMGQRLGRGLAAGPREQLKDPAVLAHALAALRARRRGRTSTRGAARRWAGAWVGGRPSRSRRCGPRA